LQKKAKDENEREAPQKREKNPKNQTGSNQQDKADPERGDPIDVKRRQNRHQSATTHGGKTCNEPQRRGVRTPTAAILTAWWLHG